ncbi:hypothetical protein KQX54_002473 [Cotesia glomerata]|uniref:Uncharacterized protein n=1 Tax=Cotesia glomerata TaxID=32391 RepID=A0AAV7HT27_COTGL|nr:hypothetical protein KQX54_002473 [Cotesia glomerata]
MNSDGKVLVNLMVSSPKPEINQVLAPDLEFDAFFDSGEIAEIFPQEFNLKKLVWISFCDNQLNVTQLGAPEETRNNIRYKHKNTTGSDRIPKRHINRPDIVKVIKPTPKPEMPESVLDKLGNSSFDREILMALPELNLKQTFWININGNNNTKVETLNTPHQKISRANGFNNSRIVKSGSNSIVFLSNYY